MLCYTMLKQITLPNTLTEALPGQKPTPKLIIERPFFRLYIQTDFLALHAANHNVGRVFRDHFIIMQHLKFY